MTLVRTRDHVARGTRRRLRPLLVSHDTNLDGAAMPPRLIRSHLDPRCASLALVALLAACATKGSDHPRGDDDASPTIASLSTTGDKSREDCRFPTISDDGRFVAFQTADDLTAAGSGRTQIYVRDRVRGTTELISVSALG